jgi:hypothetical protein
MFRCWLLLPVLSLAAISAAQTCQNDGVQNGSACSCPPGFGGATCSQPACGGTIFQGSQRNLVPPPQANSSFPNITASGCSCETGWTGTDCNVCQTSTACQNAFIASGAVSSNASTGVNDPQNNTLVCSTSPQVYAASHMSCQVLVSPLSPLKD